MYAPLNLATAFKALGDPTRLRIFGFLCGCETEVAIDEEGSVRCVNGPTVGDVCCHVNRSEKITSTMSHHLKELRLAGLITMTRSGKHFVCSVNRDAVKQLSRFLEENSSSCCDPEEK